MPGNSVLVIGGGVAGIAAAVSLADAGMRVQLVEKRPLLGGRASSYVDVKTGERVDECQHGTMRCCTNLANLYDRLGVHDLVRYHDAIHFLDGDGKRSVIKGCGFPAPLHTAISFLTFKSLGMRDKLCIGRAMLAMVRSRPDPKYDALSISAWFAQSGQTERAVKRFWTPILVSACNDVNDRISCTHAFKIFRDGFLMHPKAFHFGIPRVPLASLVTEPTCAYLQARGGCVRLRSTIGKIHFDRGTHNASGLSDPSDKFGNAFHVTGVTLTDGEHIKADTYVSALQFDLLLKLLPPEVTAGIPYWENLSAIELAPLIGVHLWFDRTIDCPEALALLDRDTEWIFNKTRNFDRSGDSGTYLSAVISASHRFKDTPNDEVLALVLADIRACLPAARDATLIRSRVVKWPKATISPKPGVDALRPDQRSPISNLLIAGEWTQTGWPSTMEGAARSGYRAAEYILQHLGRPQRIVVPDLRVTGLARLIDGHRTHNHH